MLPETAKFCLECGTPVVTRAEREVRKTVTLLFTDVTGSTALGEQLDPESYRGIMGRYFAVSRAAVERHGGTVEKFVGDAVLAVFGVPEIREDDALRAVRAAHDLNQAVAELSEELDASLGVRLEIRTGVNTGSVVAGASRAGGSFATGDAVNTAARLEQAAAPGEVLLGHSTWELVRDAVEVEEADPVVAKGKAEPVRAFRLLGVDVGAEGRRRRTDVEMIGRARETRALDDALDRMLESGRGHLVTVTGAPGIGKSRLVAEFLDRVGDRADVLRGRCISYGQGITYWPVIQLLREAYGLEGDESPDVTRHALLQIVPDADAGAPAEVVDLLMPLLGKGGEAGGSDQTFWAVSRVLEQLALRRPLVVNVDDLHWAEPTLLELLDRVRDETRDLPLLLICQARPELMDEHPDWGQGSLNSIMLGLEPFDEHLTALSLGSILGPGVPPDVVAAVTGWSGGNPLFVEEIATHLVETGVLDRTEEGWRLTRDLASAGVPPTVSALLAARLDRLPAAERGLLERVSVIGLEFTSGQAALLADPAQAAECSALLVGLARRDLLRRVRDAAADTWAFRHVIVRDAAYDALPKALRGELHARVAEYLAEHKDQAGGENLAFVAHHLGQASRYADLLAPHDDATRTLSDRAVGAFMNAAQEARRREDLAGAAALLVSALDLRPGVRARRDLLVLLQVVQNARFNNDGLASAIDLYAATLDDPDEPATELDRAHFELLRMFRRLRAAEDVDPQGMRPLVDRVVALTVQAGDIRRHLLALDCLIYVNAMVARWQAVEDVLDAITDLGEPQDRRETEELRCAALINGPAPLSTLVGHSVGEATAARSPRQLSFYRLAEAVGRTGRGEPGSRGQVDVALEGSGGYAEDDPLILVLRATAVLLAGDSAAAREQMALAVDVFRRSGEFSAVSTYLAWQALLELELGTDLAIVASMVEEADELTSPYDVMSVSLVTAARAILAARSGDRDTAAELARTSLEVVDRGDQTWHRADERRWVSEVARVRGDVEEERRLLTEALELYAAKEIVTWNAQIHTRLAELDSANLA